MPKIFCFGLLLIILSAGCQRPSDKAEISIAEIWSRPVMVAGAMTDSAAAHRHHAGANGVVYLTIQNSGSAADRLLRVRTEICETVELHETIMDGDRMMMQPVENGIAIPAQGSTKLEPRGRHIMLMGLRRSLAVGDSIELHLDFEKSGTKTAFSTVRQP
ncbi:MAG: copper chaperone PCu(A)C [candidate division KSB1 bacterium]|nr:copper chaperone PCu(A)C [candidate division KSB1 bacterium]MDZ7364820.1 copper chaperone PCu(A)C [candidate division KSB1 bacterium]MDZ7402923.1 copper chaperone PCu(A)C [candidate division KSB1 bacterium]